MGIDRISNLPDNIIDQILSLLSIKDAVRTSVLSTKWRHKWAMISSLVFDNQTFPISQVEARDFASIVDCVLLLCVGPINKFELSYGAAIPFHHIDRWMLYLSRGSIKELVLNIVAPMDRYKLPSCVFFFQCLSCLKLKNCLLKPTLLFEGFVNLKHLELIGVTLDQDVCGKLISSSPVLERLTLWQVNGVSHLHIVAPNLQALVFGGSATVSFENTSCLASVAISDWKLGNSMNILKGFSNIPNLQYLSLAHTFTKCLFNKVLPREQPKLCSHVKVLVLFLRLDRQRDILKALYLIRCTPNLEVLMVKSLKRVADAGEISLGIEQINASFREADYSSCTFVQLRKIMILDIVGSPREMDLINYMLSASPMLETMTVKPRWDCGFTCVMLKTLLRFKRASMLAEIIFEDP